MSSTKNVILPFKYMDAISLGANITGNTIDVTYIDRVCFEVQAGSGATGSFNLEGSVSGLVWVPFSIAAMSLSGSADNKLIDVQVTAISKLRLTYTKTSGTGTVTVWASGKVS